MAERIFPTQQQEQLGSKLEFNGIDINTVLEKLAESEDDTKKNALSPELREQIAQLKINTAVDEDEDGEREAKKAIPEAFKEHMFKAKNNKSEDEEDSTEEDTETTDDVVEGKKTASRRRRVRFTCASQLSPDALEAAKANGDDELHAAILAARSDIRVREAQKLLDLSEETLTKEASKRQGYRVTVVNQAEATKQAVASVADEVKDMNQGVFKTVQSMTDDERTYFQRIALNKGLPEEYVNSMFATNNVEERSSVENDIRDIMASTLADTTKKTAIGSLVKTATLDNENISRLKKYWKEELGYGDEEWIDDLFTTKYN